MVGKNENKFNFLVFEDNPIFRKGLTAILERIGHVDQVDQKKNAENLIKERKYDIAFIDLFIGDDLEGLDLVTLTKENNTYAVVLSSCQDMEIIEKAYKRGCNDCLSKTNYREHIDAILAKFQSSNQNKLNDVLKSEYVTQDAGIIASLERLVECNDFDRAIFLSGPSGVGKTQIARAIHKLAGGSEENFVNLNCSCTNDDLLESEMFGHVE
ncbi:MAG: response regulator, partial [Bacteriovoracaceae bacterium]|nr:response regulator [Bacteriovoracaceae bacterium]